MATPGKKQKAECKEDKGRNVTDLDSKWMSNSFKPPILATNYHEYLNSEKDISVIGSLKHHWQFWESIDAPEFALNIVKNSYTTH